MKRLFVLVIGGLLGTGCVSSSADVCDSHTVFVGWPDFVVATAGGGYQTTNSCSGIFRMDVFVDNDQQPWSANCADDVVPVQVGTGSHTLTVEAVDNQNFPILRDVVQVSVPDSCNDLRVDTRPGEGWVALRYAFDAPGTCVAGGSFIWFNVHDDIAGVEIAGANKNANPTMFACNAAPPVSGQVAPPFPLPAGNYTLDWMEEVFLTTVYNASATECSPTTFAVNSGVDASVGPVHLFNTVALTDFCPGTAP